MALFYLYFLYVVRETKSRGTYLGESSPLKSATRCGQHRQTIENMDESKAVGKSVEEQRASK